MAISPVFVNVPLRAGGRGGGRGGGGSLAEPGDPDVATLLGVRPAACTHASITAQSQHSIARHSMAHGGQLVLHACLNWHFLQVTARVVGGVLVGAAYSCWEPHYCVTQCMHICAVRQAWGG